MYASVCIYMYICVYAFFCSDPQNNKEKMKLSAVLEALCIIE